MPKPFSFFTRKKSTKTFKEYYTEWLNTLKTNLLPLLHQSLSFSPPFLLSSHVDLLLHHLLSYYDSLDLAATSNHHAVPHLLFPPWRNSLEKPFLFLGDLHPYLFTNLLRSFLDHDDDEEQSNDVDGETHHEAVLCQNTGAFDKPWQVVVAWKDPSENLMARIEQIECGLRLMVPALVSRWRKVQGNFVGMVAENWVKSEGKKDKFCIGEAMNVEMEELVSVLVDANRLRRSVISEIVSALSVYQAASFLESLAQILVGFRDEELVNEFEKCKKPISGRTHTGF